MTDIGQQQQKTMDNSNNEQPATLDCLVFANRMMPMNISEMRTVTGVDYFKPVDWKLAVNKSSGEASLVHTNRGDDLERFMKQVWMMMEEKKRKNAYILVDREQLATQWDEMVKMNFEIVAEQSDGNLPNFEEVD